MLWNFRRPIALPTTSPCKWILKGPRFSSFPFHNDKTSPSEVEDTPQSFWHHLKKEDMDMFRMLKAANGAITKEFYAKMQAKPDILRVFLAQRRAAQKQKYQTVTKFRTSRIRIAKDWYQAHKQDESYRRRCNMYLWCFHPTFRRPWIDHLPWPTHRPLAYRQKVAHCCAECGTRHSGLKSWWQSVKDPDSFLCHKHYTDRGWSECMPKGYEHVRTFKGLNARYKELNQE